MYNIDPTWEDYARELGINIARARTAKGYSQDRFAAEAGLRASPTGSLKEGNRPRHPPNPRLRSILAVAQALDIELADLLPKHTPDLRRR